MISSFTLRRVVLTGVLLMFGAHLLALLLSGQSAMSTPISQLSRASGSGVHTAGLLLLALVQLAVGALLSRTEIRSRLWTAAVWLTVFNGICLVFIAVYFLRAPASLLFGPDANDPLAVLASSVGVVMGLLQRDLRKFASRCARYNGAFFVLWLALIPVIPFIDAAWLGAYERIVGGTLLAWLAMLALLCPDGARPQST